MNLIEYITRLAPEGETALVVRQKPQLKDNELQFHADGAVKCTWPAYLPTYKMKPNESWYGNTGSFIIDRFEDGRVSASAANCEYVLVMMLDDVGDSDKTTKSPTLPPTWIMETSEGSYQWGYAFSEQPSKGDYTAAIKAIAEAGYCDKGATNAVRNFRLPGSINIKPGRDNFAARLVEFHPKREYTLDEICTALDVVPAESDTTSNAPIRLADTGSDSVVKWLNDNGLVLSPVNGEGWMGVICPNHAEHTDGNPEARYKPLDRSFCCLHSHCIDFDSNTFLKWVSENDGPKVMTGLRDELLAAVMEQTLSKLTCEFRKRLFHDSSKQLIT